MKNSSSNDDLLKDQDDKKPAETEMESFGPKKPSEKMSNAQIGALAFGGIFTTLLVTGGAIGLTYWQDPHIFDPIKNASPEEILAGIAGGLVLIACIAILANCSPSSGVSGPGCFALGCFLGSSC